MCLSVKQLTVVIEPGLFIGILTKVMQNRQAIFAAMLRPAGVMKQWLQLMTLGMSWQPVML